MPATKPPYHPEFRAQAVQLVKDSGKPLQPGLRVRPFDAASPADWSAVQRIFELTGLFGEPVADYFHAPGFIADTMLGYYLELEQPWVLLADDGQAGQVVGYITGCPDTARRSRLAVSWILPKLVASMARNRLLADRAAWLLAWRSLPEQIAKTISPHGRLDLRPYPAHLHMAVDPAFQRRGVGQALLVELLKRLREAGVPGVHLETTNHHQAAMTLYRRAGFQEIARHRIRAFDHMLPPSMLPVERIVLALALRQAASGLAISAGRPS